MNTSRAFVRPVAIATIALVAPLLMVSSGEAATTDSGCTVAPKRPKFTGDTTGGNVPIIEYKSTVTCDAGLVLNLEGKILESDQLAIEGDAPDDLTGTFSRTLDFTAGAGTQTVTVRRPLPNTGSASEGPAGGDVPVGPVQRDQRSGDLAAHGPWGRPRPARSTTDAGGGSGGGFGPGDRSEPSGMYQGTATASSDVVTRTPHLVLFVAAAGLASPRPSRPLPSPRRPAPPFGARRARRRPPERPLGRDRRPARARFRRAAPADDRDLRAASDDDGRAHLPAGRSPRRSGPRCAAGSRARTPDLALTRTPCTGCSRTSTASLTPSCRSRCTR